MTSLRVEIRPDDDGAVDEVLLYADERCVFHLERMSNHGFWFALYPSEDIANDHGEHFDIFIKKQKVTRKKKKVMVTHRD